MDRRDLAPDDHESPNGEEVVPGTGVKGVATAQDPR